MSSSSPTNVLCSIVCEDWNRGCACICNLVKKYKECKIRQQRCGLHCRMSLLRLFSNMNTHLSLNSVFKPTENECLILKKVHFESQSHLQFHLQLWSLLPGSWSPWWLCGTLSLCSRNLSAEAHAKCKPTHCTFTVTVDYELWED